MNLAVFLSISWHSVLTMALLTVLGFVLVPKIPTDVQRRRAWLGLGLLLTTTLLGLITQIVSLQLWWSHGDHVLRGVVDLVSGVVLLALSMAGIAILLTVAVVGVKKHTYGVQPYAPQSGPTIYGAPGGQDSPIGTTQPGQTQQTQTQPGQTQPGQTPTDVH